MTSESIEIDITDEQKELLIAGYVRDNISESSIGVYNESLDAGYTTATALKDAILNEMLIKIIVNIVDEAEDTNVENEEEK